jgi:hypothetical protein
MNQKEARNLMRHLINAREIITDSQEGNAELEIDEAMKILEGELE